jgi:hypothetical protein
MPAISQLEQYLWASSLVLTAVLILRMVWDGLVPVYTGFFVYLCASVVQTLAMLPFSPNTTTYAWLFIITQPVIWLLSILIVLELFSLILRRYQGIASLGRWTMMAALGLAVLIALITLLPDLQNVGGRYRTLIYYNVIERGINSSLVIFLLVISAFVVWYPLPLSRNVILHAIVYSVYFLCSTLALFIQNTSGLDITRTVSTILIALTCACLLVWILFLRRQGEEQKVSVRRQWHPEEGERIVRQLDAINAALLRSSRK